MNRAGGRQGSAQKPLVVSNGSGITDFAALHLDVSRLTVALYGQAKGTADADLFNLIGKIWRTGLTRHISFRRGTYL